MNMRMKNLLITLLTSTVFTVTVHAQSLGVGITTPNPKAALHVESPTSNQGFIMPRLTTAQRTALGSLLVAGDNGLMLYDTDIKAIYIWNGTAWTSSAALATATSQASANPLLDLTNTGTGKAASFSVNNGANTSAAIYATTNGTGSPTTSAAILGETSTAFAAVTGVVTGPGGSNAIFGTSSSSNTFSYAVYGGITGGGVAGKFDINNASNTSTALEVSTNGTGGGAKFIVNNTAATLPSFWAQTNSNQPLTAAVYGLNTGTGDAAGYFRINNAASTKIALAGETNGAGSSVYGLNLGTGNGAYFRKNGSNSGSSAVWGDNFGNDGYGGIFQNISTTNPKSALYAESAGTGASIWALKTTGDVSGDALLAQNDIASGSSGKFQNSNASNSSSTVVVTTNSSTNGTAISATHTGIGDAVYGVATSGSGGNFQNANASNNASAMFAITNAPSGHAVGAMNTAEGSAFSIFQGGMKVSTATLSAGTAIATRAVAYLISGGGPYSFSFTPTDGDIFYFFNSTGAPVAVGVYAVPANAGKTFIFLGGSLRGL